MGIDPGRDVGCVIGSTVFGTGAVDGILVGEIARFSVHMSSYVKLYQWCQAAVAARFDLTLLTQKLRSENCSDRPLKAGSVPRSPKFKPDVAHGLSDWRAPRRARW